MKKIALIWDFGDLINRILASMPDLEAKTFVEQICRRVFNLGATLSGDSEATWIFAIDDKAKNWRKAEYDLYKSNRADSKKKFLGRIFERMAIMGYEVERPEAVLETHSTILEKSFQQVGGYTFKQSELEADDIMSLLLEKLDEQEYDEAFLFAGDSDLFQLLVKRKKKLDVTYLRFTPFKKPLFYKTQWGESLYYKIGLALAKAPVQMHPKAVPLYKATVGDASDCVPGISGIGPKFFSEVISALDFSAVEAIQSPDDAWCVLQRAVRQGVLSSKFQKKRALMLSKSPMISDNWKTWYELVDLSPINLLKKSKACKDFYDSVPQFELRNIEVEKILSALDSRRSYGTNDLEEPEPYS